MRMSDDHDKNLEKALGLVEKAAKRGARIICLPELYRTQYFPQKKRGSQLPYHETIPGESTRAFAHTARRHGVAIIVPIYEHAKSGRLYNSAAVINERGRLLTTYRKVHIPHDQNFWEKDYFTSGSTYRIYRTSFAKFAVLICYDQWFPEAARSVALRGAEIIFYPTAIGRIVPRMERDSDWKDAWETAMRGQAITNAVHVAAVNRVGKEGRIAFWGGSFIADSFGVVLRRASQGREEVLVQGINLDRNVIIREGWEFFRNRRPETYRSLVKKTRRS